ncbi:MAG: patatin [Gemmatimonadales bacterium]|nr:patatin [Candidatus Palauibacter denitrificans]
MYKILSIDGGGIRGVIPAVVLNHLEAEVGKPTHKMFDLIVGTSTGGILAALLTAPHGCDANCPADCDDTAKYSAEQILDFYKQHGKEIFSRSWNERIARWWRRSHDHQPLERLLAEHLGDAQLSQCLAEIVVTSYDLERRDTYFFKSSKARTEPDRDHYLAHVARATSAGPTYFEPAVVQGLGEHETSRVLIDGGVFANNPGMCAWAEAVSEGHDPDVLVLVSLGTGSAAEPIHHRKAKGWGLAGWARPIVSVLMDGTADAVDYQLKQLMRRCRCEVPVDREGDEQDPCRSVEACRRRYFRLDTERKERISMNDPSKIGKLMDKAQQILNKQEHELSRVIALLGH